MISEPLISNFPAPPCIAVDVPNLYDNFPSDSILGLAAPKEFPEETREDLIDASKYVVKWYSKTRYLT